MRMDRHVNVNILPLDSDLMCRVHTSQLSQKYIGKRWLWQLLTLCTWSDVIRHHWGWVKKWSGQSCKMSNSLHGENTKITFCPALKVHSFSHGFIVQFSHKIGRMKGSKNWMEGGLVCKKNGQRHFCIFSFASLFSSVAQLIWYFWKDVCVCELAC